jgi:hypothetical protein
MMVWEIQMRAHRNPKHIAVAILIFSMIIIPIAGLERSIPVASYEIAYGEEIDLNESIGITSSPHIPVSSVILVNDSVMSSNSGWDKIKYRYNYSQFSKVITIPFLNVSEITIRLSAHVVIGPQTVFLTIPPSSRWENTTGQTGELIEIVKHATPVEYVRDPKGPCLVRFIIELKGLDWSVIDQLYFSIQVSFTVSQCPMMIDLQRTNGESIYDLQEFRRAGYKPSLLFDDFEFLLGQSNDTIFLPNGNYSLTIRWRDYTHIFSDISILNESLIIEIRIKSVRLDVEALQKIPGLVIAVGQYDWYTIDDLYYEVFMIKDSPSFYLPSGMQEQIEVEGGPADSYHRNHFQFNLQTGSNRNITLVINENWILFGNIAFTPGRLAILFVSIIVLILTIFLSKKQITKSSVVAPFIVLFLGSILPVFVTIDQINYPITLPIRSYYTRSLAWSPVISTTISSYTGTVTAIYSSYASFLNPVGLVLFILLFIVFLGVLFEVLKDEINTEYSDFLIAVPLLCCMIIQWYLVDFQLYSSFTFGASIVIGPFLTTGAFLLWFVLFKRRGKHIFESISQS